MCITCFGEYIHTEYVLILYACLQNLSRLTCLFYGGCSCTHLHLSVLDCSDEKALSVVALFPSSKPPHKDFDKGVDLYD